MTKDTAQRLIKMMVDHKNILKNDAKKQASSYKGSNKQKNRTRTLNSKLSYLNTLETINHIQCYEAFESPTSKAT